MKRIVQLDGVRGLAIMAVFLHHAFQVKMMWMGVDLFFILSGFLITGVLLNAKDQSLGKYFGHFYERRARRILVPYLITLLLGGLIFGYAWAHHWYFYILLTNFLLPLHIPHPVAFDPLWSLAVEEQFYLVWPFAVFFLSRRNLARLAIALMILAPLLRLAFHFSEHWPIYTLTPFRMDLMALGAWLSIVYRDRPELIRRVGARAGVVSAVAGVAGLLVLAHFGVSTYGNTRLGNTAIYECSLLACAGVFLWALSGSGVSVLCWRPLTYVGQVSYTIYLVHLGLLTVMLSHFSPAVAAVLGFAASLTYASISWFVLEKRLLQRPREVQTKIPLPVS